jgi:glycerophosphoryl diester phosphodiesterase
VPENTLPSIEKALDLRVGGIEIDLHLTRDGHILVSHDPWPLSDKCRTVSGQVENAPPFWSSLDLATLQSQYIADGNPDPSQYPQQTASFVGKFAPALMAGAASPFSPPSLAQVFALLELYAQQSFEAAAYIRSLSVYLEVKRTPFYDPIQLGPFCDQFEPLIAAIVKDANNARAKVVVLSFTVSVLQCFRSLLPQAEIALLTAHCPVDIAHELATLGTHLWCPHYRALRQETVQEAHRQGILVIPWTANNSQEMRILLDWQVDRVMTDHPQQLQELISEKPEKNS